MLSRSPSIVSVALQLPDSECGGSNRLTGKFPATTTLWLLLRQFESGSTDSEPDRNFTARGIPQIKTEGNGSERLFYETPVLQIMGRELTSFTDLQKSLAQLGFNSGSVLLRLNFRRTEKPFEEAVADIDNYFKSDEVVLTGDTHPASARTSEPAPSASQSSHANSDSGGQLHLELSSSSKMKVLAPQLAAPSCFQSPQCDEAHASHTSRALQSDTLSNIGQTIEGPTERPISVLAPSSESTPAASRQAFNEKDYEPTIAHARLHQARLATSSVNRRLPTDAELAVEADIQAKKNADTKDVHIKIRFPDQMQVVSTFSSFDTSTTLHDFVKGLMERENEPFSLTFSSAHGSKIVPKGSTLRLIGDLGMAGRVLVNVAWEAGASSDIRGGSVLKPEFQIKATQIEVKEIEGFEVEEKVSEIVEGKGKQKDKGRERKGGIPPWLKLPGKK